VDLTSGNVTEVLSSTIWPWNVELSPNESILAYLTSGEQRYSGGQLVLRDLGSGTERRVNMPQNASTWGLTWSPTGAKLAYMMMTNDDACSPTGFSIILLDTATLAQTLLIQEGWRLLEIVRWPDDERTLLVDRDRKYWWLSSITGEVQSAPEVPTLEK